MFHIPHTSVKNIELKIPRLKLEIDLTNKNDTVDHNDQYAIIYPNLTNLFSQIDISIHHDVNIENRQYLSLTEALNIANIRRSG